MVTQADRQVWLLLRLALALAVYRSKATAEPVDFATAAALLEHLPASPATPPAGFDVSALIG
jgi:hypothetical protein